MKLRGYGKLPAERTGHSPSPNLMKRREAIMEAAISGVWRTEPAAEERVFNGVRTLYFQPPVPPRAFVVHLHGGGFHLGCPEMDGPFAAALAKQCGVAVLCPAYRLAPEFPMPAALRDIRTVLDLIWQRDLGPLIISGSSAGGGLAASVTAARVAGKKSPTGLILLSPWLDLTASSDSYETNATTDPVFSRAAAKEDAALYLQGVPQDDPLASPLFGDLKGFPPTFISVSKEEVLADDSRRFNKAMHAAGACADLLEIAGMRHAAVARRLTEPGAVETFGALSAFVDRLLLTT